MRGSRGGQTCKLYSGSVVFVSRRLNSFNSGLGSHLERNRWTTFSNRQQMFNIIFNFGRQHRMSVVAQEIHKTSHLYFADDAHKTDRNSQIAHLRETAALRAQNYNVSFKLSTT